MRDLSRVFNPGTVAVVGDKRANDYMWLRALKSFSGRLYSVQIDSKELPGIAELGVPNFSSLSDIPEPVDYVIIAVPRGVAPRVLADCIKKGVGGASLFTSGFAETNTEEGRQLQNTLVKMASEADFNLIGPNCMGIYNPKLGLRTGKEQYFGEGGPVGFISQSGTHATIFSTLGRCHGVNISKSVSFGNGAVLESSDYLEYLADDPETKIIGMYIEGVRDGRRLFRCLREASRKKPVIIWKGGRSEDGIRAASSHTGSLTASPLVWESMIKQSGAIKVDNMDEMIDVMKALLYLKPPEGRNVALVAQSGGQSVVLTDAFALEGMKVPLLSDSSYRQFSSFFNVIGGSCANPLDISWNSGSTDVVVKILEVLAADSNVDCLVLELWVVNLHSMTLDGSIEKLISALVAFRGSCGKSFATVLTAWHMEAEAVGIRQRLVDAGLPVFPTFGRAARALRQSVDYSERRGKG